MSDDDDDDDDDDGSGVSAAPHSFLPYAAVRRKSTCIVQEGRSTIVSARAEL